MFNTLSFNLWKENPTKFSAQLGDNFKKWGFCAIKDHPINTSLIEEVLGMFKDFFSYPLETKAKYYKKELAGSRGYTPFRIETPKDGSKPDLKEFWHIGRELPENHRYNQWMDNNLWVQEIDCFRSNTIDLFDEFNDFGNTLLKSISIYLDIDMNSFTKATDYGNSILRAIHYPKVNGTYSGERAGAHEDINLITLLANGHQPGLEILNPQNKWVAVDSQSDTIICNIGDMMQRFTNHKLKSTTHRVRALGNESISKSRYSIPFFLHPNPDWVIKTLDNCISKVTPNLYPDPIMAEDYLRERLIEINLA